MMYEKPTADAIRFENAASFMALSSGGISAGTGTISQGEAESIALHKPEVLAYVNGHGAGKNWYAEASSYSDGVVWHVTVTVYNKNGKEKHTFTYDF